MSEPGPSQDPVNGEIVARILGALGQLMIDFHNRDLAVQNAISELTALPDTLGLNVVDLQHIDLVTQTHADLAKFLPKLAQSLREEATSEASLAGTLTLRSLKDVLLGAEPSTAATQDPLLNESDPGEMHLF